MLKDFVSYLLTLKKPENVEIDGRKYSLTDMDPITEPTLDAVVVRSLTAVVDYLNKQVDQAELSKLFCHVESPTQVRILSHAFGPFKQRENAIVAKVLEKPNGYKHCGFDEYNDAEPFNIWMQAAFVDDPDTDKDIVMAYVGNIKDTLVRGIGDDGISQEMSVRVGIATVENVKVPNPVLLRPYRTFNEVQQPASRFVFRAKSGGEFALFEADNGMWRNEAMQNIKTYMEEQVPGLLVIA